MSGGPVPSGLRFIITGFLMSHMHASRTSETLRMSQGCSENKRGHLVSLFRSQVRVYMRSKAPSGGMNEIVLSFSNLASRTH